MKLCYDELEKHNVRLTKPLGTYPGKRFATHKGVPGYQITGTYLEYAEHCAWCGEPYLRIANGKNTSTQYCCKEHRHEDALWKKEWRKRAETLKFESTRNTRAMIQKTKSQELAVIRKAEKEERQRKFKIKKRLGEYEHALYNDSNVNTFSRYYNIRQSVENPELLQTTCANCNKWFHPTKDKLVDIRQFINGKSNKHTTFYCCPECFTNYHKLLDSIVKEYKYKLNEPQLLLKKEKRKKYWEDIENKRKIEEERKKQKLDKALRKKEFKEERRQIRLHKVNKIPSDPVERNLYQITNRNEFKMKEPKEFKLRKLMYLSKMRSKQRNLEFNIDLNFVKKLAETDTCAVTGIKFDYNPNWHRNPFGPSIDRINIQEGYNKKNCILTIWAYNSGKAHYDERDLYYMCKQYLKFNNII